MTRLLVLLAAFVVFVGAALASPPAAHVNDAAIVSDTKPRKLSEFGFFADAEAQSPVASVQPYTLNAPLFSDYALKQRFAYIPAGKSAKTGDNGELIFPVGSALIKSFGYDRGEGIELIETRVLLHRADGWVALPYIWDADGRDASLKVAGRRLPVSFIGPSGAKRDISYAVPNMNQCKGCHALKGEITPIGPKLRNMDDGAQIDAWKARGWLAQDVAVSGVMPDYADTHASLDSRARAYLDINCAHCHTRDGPASNSGLFLGFEETGKVSLGIGKRPVAAGRGSGGREFAIAPGDADASIFTYRMDSTDPGIAMPELGRSIVHDEGVALIREWITAMGADGTIKTESGD